MKLVKNTISSKLIVTGILTLLMFIPLGLVNSVIEERESLRNHAVAEVNNMWGRSQKIMGPVLVIPYRSYYRDSKNILRTRIKKAAYLPESLTVKGDIIPEKRSRGLYEVVLYKLNGLKFKGKFLKPDGSKLGISKSDLLLNRAFISMGIPDTRGIQEKVSLKWNKSIRGFLPGTGMSKLFSSGIHAPVKLEKKKTDFEFSLNLRGSSSISFAPLAKETRVILSSVWQHPSFFGAYPPVRRKITDKGFTAEWKVSYFGRNFPQQWKENNNPGASKMSAMSFGVKMYMPVDFYQKCVRAVKYGMLFIALTFLCFFLFEVFNDLSIHPLQYIMVGCAMVIFYLLFVSISEHINFNLSYLISSVSVIGLITGYSIKVLKNKSGGLMMSGILTILYLILYVLLQNEDYSLFLGSLLLFVVLGTVMYITRNVDWYETDRASKNFPKDQAMLNADTDR